MAKTFVPRTTAPQSDEKWWKVGQNPCIARYNGTVLPNCFVGNTEIITSMGVVTLKKAKAMCDDGVNLEVPTIDGEWHVATVKYFGVQEIYRVKLEGSTYFCTANHRWHVCSRRGDKTFVLTTENLKSSMRIPYRMCNTEKSTRVISVKSTHRSEGVYCVVEPVTKTFTLAGGEITGNCVGYAHGRFCEILGYFHPDLPTCNAGDWIDRLQSRELTWGKDPQIGAAAVWKRTGKAGHVAIVEYVYDDGTIMLSESGYSASWDTRFWNSGPRSGPNWWNTSNYVFQGFIYNPGVKDVSSIIPFEGGVAHGTSIAINSPRYSSDVNPSDVSIVSTAAYSNAVDHPARKFVQAAIKHLGKDGQKWVKETTRAVVPGWSTAMCCAAAKECGYAGKVMPGNVFFTSGFGKAVVETYGGKYIQGGSATLSDSIQTGDVFGLKDPNSGDKYGAIRLGIVRDLAGDTILTVEGDLGGDIALHSRRIKDVGWFVRPDWTKVGGTAECSSLMVSPLYTSRNSRADAIMREVGSIDSQGKPSISLEGIKLSAINYTSMLSGVYDAAGFSSKAYSQTITSTTPGAYSVDSTGLQPPVAREIFNFLLGKGLSAAQSVGFLANIQQESSFDPGAINSSSGSIGICQWLGSRKKHMLEACGTDWANNLTGQLEFLWTELNGEESKTLTSLREVTGNDLASAKLCATIVLKQFERPGNYDEEVPRREGFAENLWNQILVTQNTTGTFVSSATNTTIVTKSGNRLECGSSVIIPSNVKQTGIIPNFTNYTKFFSRWNRKSVQKSLALIWDEQGRPSQYHIATINGYYLIALTPKFGTVGDIVSIILEDGTCFNCILGDQKGADAKSEWGHYLTADSVDVVEWEAIDGDQDSLKAGLVQAGWSKKKVSEIVNYGSWING